jgi:hypothetical protein
MGQEQGTGSVITLHGSYGTIWGAGELIAGQERDGTYSVVLCVEPREVRGGRVVAKAKMAVIKAATWSAVCWAVQSLGFTRPTLTAAQVVRGRR